MRPSRDKFLDWQAILRDAVEKPGAISEAYSTFWNYSVGNQLAAWFQCIQRGIELGPIHTYQGWRQLGRQVKKGEKALVLTMPVSAKDRQRQTANAEIDPAVGDGAERLQPATRTIFIERAHWFVLSQTQGEDYVPLAIPAWKEALALCKLFIDRVPFRHADGNCQGFAVRREFAISPIAFMPHRTTFHEIAHIVLGHTEELQGLHDGNERTPRDVREVEAECVALICCESLGLPGAEFSRGYIQHWLHRETIAEKSVHRIFKAAESILKAGRDVPDSV